MKLELVLAETKIKLTSIYISKSAIMLFSFRQFFIIQTNSYFITLKLLPFLSPLQFSNLSVSHVNQKFFIIFIE